MESEFVRFFQNLSSSDRIFYLLMRGYEDNMNNPCLSGLFQAEILSIRNEKASEKCKKSSEEPKRLFQKLKDDMEEITPLKKSLDDVEEITPPKKSLDVEEITPLKKSLDDLYDEKLGKWASPFSSDTE